MFSSASTAPVSPAAVALGFGVNDGDDLGEWRAGGGYCDGLDSASHRHTITCVHDNTQISRKLLHRVQESKMKSEVLGLVARRQQRQQAGNKMFMRPCCPHSKVRPHYEWSSPFRSVVHFPDCIFKLQCHPWSDIIHPRCFRSSPFLTPRRGPLNNAIF